MQVPIATSRLSNPKLSVRDAPLAVICCTTTVVGRGSRQARGGLGQRCESCRLISISILIWYDELSRQNATSDADRLAGLVWANLLGPTGALQQSLYPWVECGVGLLAVGNWHECLPSL